MTYTISRSHWNNIPTDYKLIKTDADVSAKRPDWTGNRWVMVYGPALVPCNVLPDKEWFKFTKLEWIRQRAARNDIELKATDFEMREGAWTLDGMDPEEWLDAMLMD